MSDNFNDMGSVESSENMGVDNQEKKAGPLPEFVILILKIIAAGIGLIILTATVSVIVFGIMGGDTPRGTLVDTSQEYNNKPEVLLWFSNIDEIRAQTKDEPPKSVILEVNIGYRMGEEKLTTELNSRVPRLRAMIRSYISQQRKDDLAKEEELKEALKTKINQILSEGQIQEVIFQKFDIFEF